ncbi:hypothetical protein FRB95_013347 [Tulasnella sp. JGI-2019a]|nr:hypothetical protein FRB95_013347 [Tulasnella sp. JGI-2019a]
MRRVFGTAALTALADITILWNDLNRLTYTGADLDTRMFGDPQNAGKGCGQGYQATSTSGSSVSFNFTGTALRYTFLADGSGSNAIVNVDSTQYVVPTYQANTSAYLNCSIVTNSIPVRDGLHLVKIVNSPPSTNLTVMYFQSVAYTPSVRLSGSSRSAIIGGIIGGVIGLVLIIAAAIYDQRRRRDHVVDLLDAETSSTNNDSPSHQEEFHHENSTSATPFIIPSSSDSPSDALLADHPGASSSLTAVHDHRTNEKGGQTIRTEPILRPTNTSATTGGMDPAFIRELMQHNVPGPEIATLIRTMAAREGQSSSQIDVRGRNPPDTTAPPAYDRN